MTKSDKKMVDKKAKKCDECVHFVTKGETICALGHKPRFFQPNPYETDYGWKRKCGDFQSNGKAPKKVLRYLEPDELLAAFGDYEDVNDLLDECDELVELFETFSVTVETPIGTVQLRLEATCIPSS